MRFLFATMAVALLTPAATAQRTWIVDAGGGGDFTNLPPVLAVARSGDTVLVRPGTYTPGATSEGIAIVGTNAVLRGSPVFRVSNLAPNETFVMSGFTHEIPTFSTSMLLTDNLGLVHLQDVSLAVVAQFAGFGRPALEVRRCANVSLAGSAFWGEPGLVATDSRIVATECRIGGAGFVTRLVPGIDSGNSSIKLSQTQVTGGDWRVFVGGLGAGSGIRMTGGSLDVCGARSQILGGTNWQGLGGGNRAAGIESNGGSVRLDRQVANAITRFGTSVFAILPLACVTVAGVPPGGTLQPAFDIPLGLPAAIAASLPGTVQGSVFGDFWLDPATTVTLFVGTWPPANAIQIPLNQNFVRGTGVAFQGIVLFNRGLELTAPAIATVR